MVNAPDDVIKTIRASALVELRCGEIPGPCALQLIAAVHHPAEPEYPSQNPLDDVIRGSWLEVSARW